MRHLPSPTRRALAVLTPLLLALASVAGAQTPTPFPTATPVPTPTPNPVVACASALTIGIREYVDDMMLDFAPCEVDKLKGNVCDTNDLQKKLTSDGNDLNKQVTKGCSPVGQDALCPLESDVLPELLEALLGDGSESLKGQVTQLFADLFTTPYAGCPRPTGAVSRSAEECGEKLADVFGGQELLGDVANEFFSCERPRLLNTGLELCVDDVIGEPIKGDLIENVDDLLNEGLETLDPRCEDADIHELGCPLGATTLDDLKLELDERVRTFVEQLDLRIFHSDCQGNLPGGPTEPVPATVVLRPGGIRKLLHCGQTIDADFMAGNKSVVFESDLDCGPSQTATDGIVVEKPGVILNGAAGKKWSIRGPRRSSLRTGVGIKLLPGAGRTTIKNFKAIENFGVGIEDADEGNRKLKIIKTTVRRNIVAGLRLRSPRAVVNQVVADKNGIGMDLSGDGIRVTRSQAKGSLYEPKIGIRLSGVDRTGDGKIVRIESGAAKPNIIELNQGTGIHIVEGGHYVIRAQVRDNLGNGILIDPLGVGSEIDSNSVKLNANGIVVRGDGNLIESNTAEQNTGDGFVVESVPIEGGGTIGGLGNIVLKNSSGKKTDRGNGGVGYRIGGTGTLVQDNEAEANLGAGFVVTGPTVLFKGNSAQENLGSGFDLQSPGNVIEACAAERNNQAKPAAFHEWVFVDGQVDDDGNKVNGDTIKLPATAGFCDAARDCPRSK